MTTTTKQTANSVTIREVLADAKRHGLEVTRAKRLVNGTQAYSVWGKNGLFTKQGLVNLVGIYADSAPLEDKS